MQLTFNVISHLYQCSGVLEYFNKYLNYSVFDNFLISYFRLLNNYNNNSSLKTLLRVLFKNTFKNP